MDQISQQKDNFWQDRLEELFGIISDLEKVIEKNDHHSSAQVVKTAVRKSTQLVQRAMHNVTLGGGEGDISMMNPFNVMQNSKLEISATSLISKHDDEV